MKDLKFPLAAMVLSIAASGALAQQKMDDMKGMPMEQKAAPASNAHHKAKGTVQKLDPKAGLVTIAHGPVPTLNWPAMSMEFKVKDKAVMRKLHKDKKVDVEFVKEGDDYVVTRVK